MSDRALVPGSGAGIEDEGLVYPSLRRPGRACEGAGEFGFAVLAGAGLVDADGPFVGGSLVAQAQDGRGPGAAGQERGDVAVLAAVADERLAEAGRESCTFRLARVSLVGDVRFCRFAQRLALLT